MILDQGLIRLNVFGVTLLNDGMRPILLLKDDSGELTLPVPLHPLEAGMTLSQTNPEGKPTTPHKVTEMLLKSIGVRITRCVFVDTKPQTQIVQLELANHPKNQDVLQVSAEQAMSLCLQLNVPIYASRDYVLRSRQMVAEEHAQVQQFNRQPNLLKRTHPYLM